MIGRHETIYPRQRKIFGFSLYQVYVDLWHLVLFWWELYLWWIKNKKLETWELFPKMQTKELKIFLPLRFSIYFFVAFCTGWSPASVILIWCLLRPVRVFFELISVHICISPRRPSYVWNSLLLSSEKVSNRNTFFVCACIVIFGQRI